MNTFSLLATPWPVNLLILVPIIVFLGFRKRKLNLSPQTFIFATIFGIAFGFVEASCVIYVRAALGFLPGYMISLTEAAQQSFNVYQQNLAVDKIPKSLLTVELFREAATMVMLLGIGFLSAIKTKDRLAIFLWIFAVWDIFYYLWLWMTVRWPYSLTTTDVLFLIPVPWYSQVWLPILVSVLTILAIGFNRDKTS